MRIVISGSISFAEHYQHMQTVLQEYGHTVVIPLPIAEHGDILGNETNRKKTAMDDYFHEIANADCLLVANYTKNSIEGYIGACTLMEMTVAYFCQKNLFCLFGLSSVQPAYEEIVALQPHILEGSLDVFVSHAEIHQRSGSLPVPTS